MTFAFSYLDTPIGRLRLDADGDVLCGVWFPGHRGTPPARGREQPDRPILREARAQLGGHLAGTRTAFDLPCRASGTALERQVWAALARIPYGTTTTYGAVARAIGRPGAARAVGSANAKNPLSIGVPCHRVIGAGGTLTGYGGGIAAKAWLLDRERARPAP
jgi:methylated-DNA-[protein]-cysteine S-methyltransferase